MTEATKDLAPWSARLSQSVAWGDMDAFGHLNNTVYFRYFESARIAYFEQIGMLDYMERTGIGPILAHTECRFRFPLHYPDQVQLDARVSSLKENEFLMEYRVISENAGAVAAFGSGRVVCVDYQRQGKVPLPEPLRAAIINIEGANLKTE